MVLAVVMMVVMVIMMMMMIERIVRNWRETVYVYGIDYGDGYIGNGYSDLCV